VAWGTALGLRRPKPDYQEIVMFLVPVTRRSSDIARLFDGSFERVFGATGQPADSARSPALDVAESEHQYTVALDLPGVAKDDVKVSIDGKRISVAAQTRQSREQKDGDRIVYRERAAASFSRSFTLPEDIDQSASSAKLDNGVLTLVLTKRRAGAASQLTIN
jgi:HSP20 family protein